MIFVVVIVSGGRAVARGRRITTIGRILRPLKDVVVVVVAVVVAVAAVEKPMIGTIAFDQRQRKSQRSEVVMTGSGAAESGESTRRRRQRHVVDGFVRVQQKRIGQTGAAVDDRRVDRRVDRVRLTVRYGFSGVSGEGGV